MRNLAIFVIAVFGLFGPAQAKPTASGAKAFLTALYAPYRTSSSAIPGPLDKPANYFESGLAAKIIADSREAAKRGDAPELDGDPICDCQDYEPFTPVIGPVKIKGNRAEADVSFNNGTERRLHYVLIATRNGWRIFDIRTQDYSLRGLYKF